MWRKASAGLRSTLQLIAAKPDRLLITEGRSRKGSHMISKELLDILACPACKSDVRLQDDKIVCSKCGRRYPVKDDIPIMLIEEAEIPKNDK